MVSLSYPIDKFKNLVSFKTGKLNSNAAKVNGVYPFFTCSQETFKTDTYSFDTECVLLGGNNADGVYPLKYFSGKVDAYQRTYIIRSLNEEKLINRYLFYALRTKLEILKSISTGATTKFLTLTILNEIEINIPPLSTQQKIASILSAYDDLIENNTRRISILEEMAQMIYREWFVKFRFPGHEKVKMVDSALGKIPEGWEVKVLGDIAEQIKRTLKPYEIDDDSPYIGLEHLPRKSIALSDWGRASEISSNKFGFKAGEILFGKIRPYFHKVGVAPIDGVCSTDAIVINSKEEKFFPFILCCVSSEEFVRQATQTSNGVKMPRANWELLLEYPVFIPEKDLFDSFSAIVRNIVSNIMSILLKNRNLRQTRYLLLPKLISGKLDVADLDIEIPETEEPELQASAGGMK